MKRRLTFVAEMALWYIANWYHIFLCRKRNNYSQTMSPLWQYRWPFSFHKVYVSDTLLVTTKEAIIRRYHIALGDMPLGGGTPISQKNFFTGVNSAAWAMTHAGERKPVSEVYQLDQ